MDMESQQDGGGDQKPVVCFLGPNSSYTHQATLETFPQDKYDLVPVVTIKDVFDATQSGDAVYGVVPFENSTNGSVVFTLDYLTDRNSLYSDLSVCAEIYLDVHHCLLGHLPPPEREANTIALGSASALIQEDASSSGQCTPTLSQPTPLKPRTKPLASLKHIQRLYSHPQAFGQCTRFLGAYLRGVETIDVSSTSRAAELAKADETGASAAISSAIAAELLDLDVLGRDIEDREDNTTRFFVLRRGVGEEGSTPPDLMGRTPKVHPPTSSQTGVKTKSLVSFTVPHAAPGALADVLECFRSNDLNLTSINSRPSLIAPFQYVFFVEFEGHRFRDPESRVGKVLEGVDKVAQEWRWLGSWDNMRA